MNTWFRRAVGTAGVAGGMLLLGAGAAHAADETAPGQLDDPLVPGDLQLDARGSNIDMSASTTTEAGQRTTSMTTSTSSAPSLLDNLPLSEWLPTNGLALPRTTSSRLPSLPALPTDAVAVNSLNGKNPNTGKKEDSLAALPLVGSVGGNPLGALGQLGALGLPVGTDSLGGTSIADTRTAFPSTPSPGRKGKTTEALPLVGDLPLGGSDVLKNDSVTGVPVIGGIGPTPGVSTTAVANRLVPTTGALPYAASQLPLVTEKAYAPKHATQYSPRHAHDEEGLPVVGGLPLLGGGKLPLIGNLLG
ncbi:hypothetical protein KZZ52_02800 [Dactylosporangium sp. AC04546]|uniref:hypothetical protein n=1 Tax=Dactylosporangium sp. AC04546 TaxID=2862460 RepID=UPI001EDD14E5|nr:hypothetical protein [Dactylosporangium sp. AC04546]WVK84382.1 hypothetical protein KZZ52_02800 [Dactylosporangium sp. AC04546]